jgi:hypothetical protein
MRFTLVSFRIHDTAFGFIVLRNYTSRENGRSGTPVNLKLTYTNPHRLRKNHSTPTTPIKSSINGHLSQ